MMRNDLPYAPPVNGRWYKIFLENDNNSLKVTSKDIDCFINMSNNLVGVYIKDKRIHILNLCIDASITNVNCGVQRSFINGSQGIIFSDINAIDTLTLYFYGVRY